MPMTVTIGTAAFLSACMKRIGRWPSPFRLGRADVVLLQHFEHGSARDACDEGDIDAAERDRRQHEVLEPEPEAFGQWRVALNGKPLELEREDIGQHITDDEDGHGEAEDGEAHDAAIDPASGLPGGEDADRHGDEDGKEQREHHERERRLEALTDELRHRHSREHRRAEIPLQDTPRPFAEAFQERAIEPERRSDSLDVFRRRLIAGDDDGGIARRDVEQAEDEQGNDPHDRDRRYDAPNDEAEHVSPAFLRPS